MATLAIKILDSASGKMAENVQVQVRKIVDGDWKALESSRTQNDGSAILCKEDVIDGGGYFELLVFLGAYFDQTGRDLQQIKMVDIVPLRFGLEAEQGDITLQMSITPHGYNADFSTETKRLNLV